MSKFTYRIDIAVALTILIVGALFLLIPFSSAHAYTYPIRVSVASDGTQGNDGVVGDDAISADGRYVAFDSYASNLVAGDTNGTYDIFVRDTVSGSTTRVSVASDGTQGNGG